MAKNPYRARSARLRCDTYTQSTSLWLPGPGQRNTLSEHRDCVVVHSWSEHVVHVGLFSDDPDITSETLRFLDTAVRRP